jgi:16S rRNA (guanine966-N2)-methyltransferase
MRIIAGTKRGMKLACPETLETRPITDRIKESLFNVLRHYDLLADSTVADLFCGVGSLGLEALSRGARFATFVEKSANITPSLERNIAQAGFADRSKIVRDSAFRVGAPVGREGHKYDLIFLDPPYAQTRQADETSPLASLFGILQRQVTPCGIVILRTEREVPIPEKHGAFEVIDTRLWGSMAIRLFQLIDDKHREMMSHDA